MFQGSLETYGHWILKVEHQLARNTLLCDDKPDDEVQNKSDGGRLTHNNAPRAKEDGGEWDSHGHHKSH